MQPLSLEKQTLQERFQVLYKLAEGGMGILFVALDLQTNQQCVLKFFRWNQEEQESLSSEGLEEEKARVHREFSLLQKASSLSSHFVDVYEPLSYHAEWGWYYPMQFLQGTPLSEHPQWGQPFSLKEGIPLVLQMAEAIRILHGLGVVHRDLTPDNIFVIQEEKPFIKVIDFGIAKDLYHRKQIFQTEKDVALGHFSYMSPEQAGFDHQTQQYQKHTALQVDQRADIYTFGCLVFEMFTGMTPFPKGNLVNFANRNWFSPPNVHKAIQEKMLPSGYDEMILSCLHPNPEMRPPDMLVFESMLQHLWKQDTQPKSNQTMQSHEIPLFSFDNLASFDEIQIQIQQEFSPTQEAQTTGVKPPPIPEQPEYKPTETPPKEPPKNLEEKKKVSSNSSQSKYPVEVYVVAFIGFLVVVTTLFVFFFLR